MIKHTNDRGAGNHSYVYRWNGVAHGAEIEPLTLRGAMPVAWQVVGDLAGAVATMHGSLDGQHWHSLVDDLGIPYERRYAGISPLSARSSYIVPHLRLVDDTAGKADCDFMILVDLPR